MAKSSPQDHDFLDPDEYESWNALLLLHRTVLAEIDAGFRRAHDLTVNEFDVLITLFNAPHRRLGMTALAERTMLSPAGVTHLVTRLERDGLVRREPDPDDGRKSFTVLTNSGDDVLKRARGVHNDILRRSFLAVTTPADRKVLRALWRRLSSPPSG